VKKFIALIAVPLIEFGSNSFIFAYITILKALENPRQKNITEIIAIDGDEMRPVKGKMQIQPNQLIHICLNFRPGGLLRAGSMGIRHIRVKDKSAALRAHTA
jgi:hypothetical protein